MYIAILHKTYTERNPLTRTRFKIINSYDHSLEGTELINCGKLSLVLAVLTKYVNILDKKSIQCDAIRSEQFKKLYMGLQLMNHTQELNN